MTSARSSRFLEENQRLSHLLFFRCSQLRLILMLKWHIWGSVFRLLQSGHLDILPGRPHSPQGLPSHLGAATCLGPGVADEEEAGGQGDGPRAGVNVFHPRRLPRDELIAAPQRGPASPVGPATHPHPSQVLGKLCFQQPSSTRTCRLPPDTLPGAKRHPGPK